MDRYAANDLYAGRPGDLYHLYLKNTAPGLWRRRKGNYGWGIYPAFCMEPRQQGFFYKANTGRRFYHDYHDGHGPGNDAKEHKRQNAERLKEEHDHLFADSGG